MSDGDGHDGAGHGHGAFGGDATFGAPGGDTGELGHADKGGNDHGHHGHHGKDGGHGGKAGRSFDGLSAYHCHHDHHHERFSFPAPNDLSVGHGPGTDAAAVDPFSATVTLQEALAEGHAKPTRAFQVHVVNHGYVDQIKLMTQLGDRISKRLFGNRTKLVRVDKGVPAMDKIEDTKKELLAWNARSGELPNRNNMPDGWLEGFTGETTMLRQYWQLAQWDCHHKRYRFDREAKTNIECYWLIWRYYQTGTYETKFMMKINSTLRFDPATQSYGFNTVPFEEHQLITTHLAEEYHRALKAATPSKLERMLLEHYSAEANRKREHGEGWFPAPKKDEQEMEDADQSDSDRTDKDPRHRDTTAADPPNAPPGDGGSAPPKIPGPPAPASAGGAPAADVPAEEGGDFDSGMGTHPPIVPMGISGADIENVLPGISVQTEKQPDMTGLKKPSPGVWVPPSENPTKVAVDVKVPK